MIREAINVGQDGNYVFVVDKDMKAQIRPVRVTYQDQSIAAIGSGVEIGERVVTDGQLRVTPGITVAITRPEGENVVYGTLPNGTNCSSNATPNCFINSHGRSDHEE